MRILFGLINLLITRLTKVPHIEAKPGVSRIVLTRNGQPVMSLILRKMTMDFQNGGSAEFVDAAKYLEARRVR